MKPRPIGVVRSKCGLSSTLSRQPRRLMRSMMANAVHHAACGAVPFGNHKRVAPFSSRSIEHMARVVGVEIVATSKVLRRVVGSQDRRMSRRGPCRQVFCCDPARSFQMPPAKRRNPHVGGIAASSAASRAGSVPRSGEGQFLVAGVG